MVSTSVEPTPAMQRLFRLQEAHQYVLARTTPKERIAKLKRLHAAMLEHAEALYMALEQDLRKCKTEVDITEIGVVNTEIRHAIRNLKSWMAPKQVDTPITLFRSSSEIRYEPKGVCLIISPWNFPVQLALAPLVSAIAAGNCVIIKPTEFAPNSTAALKKIVESCFPPEEVAVLEGDGTVAQQLLELPFNHVFFTGSPAVGKIIMGEAAKHLASVTLELGGKSPVIVDETANLDIAAAKITALKVMNAGQICIAPDYLLVQESVKDQLIAKIGEKIRAFYGQTPEARRKTPDMCRIINERHFDRIQRLLEDAVQRGAKVVLGGDADRGERYIEPTVLTEVPEGAKILEEEIFGPLLPVIGFNTLEEAIDLVNAQPKSLAMYLFSHRKKNIEALITGTRNGNVTVNDCGAHFYNDELPFGGVNNSGIGKSHGIFGFQEFSNARGILYQTRWFATTDYFMPPYGGKLAKWMLEGVKRFF